MSFGDFISRAALLGWLFQVISVQELLNLPLFVLNLFLFVVEMASITIFEQHGLLLQQQLSKS
jgi:hypothetical protein